MIYFETNDEKKILISATAAQEFMNLVAEELKEKSYRGDLVVDENNNVTALMKIYGTIIIQKEVF